MEPVVGLSLSSGRRCPWSLSGHCQLSRCLLGKSGVQGRGRGADWGPPAGVWVLQTHGGCTTPQGLNGSKTWGDRASGAQPSGRMRTLSLLICTVSWMSAGAGEPRGSMEGLGFPPSVLCGGSWAGGLGAGVRPTPNAPVAPPGTEQIVTGARWTSLCLIQFPGGLLCAAQMRAHVLLFVSGSRERPGDPPVRCSKVPLPNTSFPSGVLVATTILSVTDQPSRVCTSASASAICHSALGRHRDRVRGASPCSAAGPVQPCPARPGPRPSAGRLPAACAQVVSQQPARRLVQDVAVPLQPQAARRGA